MKEVEIDEQFRLLQQAIVLAGEAVETLKRDQRAAIDALRLDMEVLKRCLLQVHPELAAHVEPMRATLIRESILRPRKEGEYQRCWHQASLHVPLVAICPRP
jgi:hypothetical protein